MDGAVGVVSLSSSADDQLFRDLYVSLRRFAAVTAPSDLAPDDLLQEALARTLRRGPLSELADPGAYLRRTMVNLSANHRRSMGRARRALRLVYRAGEAREAEYPSDLADLERLGSRSRAVLYLTEVEGWTFAQVAELLGGTEEAARTRASRARRVLRIDLKAEESEHE
jgi:RNA polymerase sigma-70 factor (ECF subfamily)